MTATAFIIGMWIFCILIGIKWIQNRGKEENIYITVFWGIFMFSILLSLVIPVRNKIERLDLSSAKIVEIAGVKYGNPHKDFGNKQSHQEDFFMFYKLEKEPTGVNKKTQYSFFGVEKQEYSFSY